MKRGTYLLFVTLTLGASAMVAWKFATQPAEPGAGAAGAPQVLAPASAPVSDQHPALTLKPAKTTTQWISETASADATTRATAITALADAPRAEVMPVLERILTDGEPQVDRVLALRSLRDLALNQGDADGAIRDAIRHAIYHGDDLTRVEDVQEALDVIEESVQAQ